MFAKKTKKRLKKKALLRMRMQKLRLIMTAIRAQRKVAERTRNAALARKFRSKDLNKAWLPDEGSKILKRIKRIRGRIAAARLRVLSRWKSVK